MYGSVRVCSGSAFKATGKRFVKYQPKRKKKMGEKEGFIEGHLFFPSRDDINREISLRQPSWHSQFPKGTDHRRGEQPPPRSKGGKELRKRSGRDAINKMRTIRSRRRRRPSGSRNRRRRCRRHFCRRQMQFFFFLSVLLYHRGRRRQRSSRLSFMAE